jgi:two-component system nitrate/nitrite sensor histidine kinase NarQ
VEIRRAGAEAVITLSDQGRGFAYAENQHSGSMGLKSLESRAGELNGRLSIETAPNEGCRVTLILPAYGGE